MYPINLIVLCVLICLCGLQSLISANSVPASSPPIGNIEEQIIQDFSKLSSDLDTIRNNIDLGLKQLTEAQKQHGSLKILVKELFGKVSIIGDWLEVKNTTAAKINPPKLKKYIILEDTARYTWYSAKLSCERSEMTLASVESEEEQRALEAAIKSIGYEVPFVWIGGSDIKTEDNFYWISGKPINYTNWAIGNYSNSIKENCLAVQGNYYAWHVKPCDDYNIYVCQYWK